MSREGLFPMLDGPAIDWGTAARIYEEYAYLYGLDQSLEGIAERGGFGWEEVSRIWAKAQKKRKAKVYLA